MARKKEASDIVGAKMLQAVCICAICAICKEKQRSCPPSGEWKRQCKVRSVWVSPTIIVRKIILDLQRINPSLQRWKHIWGLSGANTITALLRGGKKRYGQMSHPSDLSVSVCMRRMKKMLRLEWLAHISVSCGEQFAGRQVGPLYPINCRSNQNCFGWSPVSFPFWREFSPTGWQCHA